MSFRCLAVILTLFLLATLLTHDNATAQGGSPSRAAPAALGTLCIYKYEDKNHNGKKDAGEGPLSGWTFTIQNQSTGALVISGTSNSQGEFCKDVPVGTYSISETLVWGNIPVGLGDWVNTDPGGIWPVKAKHHQKVLKDKKTIVLFGNYLPLTRLCVEKYLDVDGNGHWGLPWSEPKLAGWSFSIRDASGNIVASGVTDANGAFCVDLKRGDYTITETSLLPDWTNTEPGGTAPFKKSVSLVSALLETVRFGNRPIIPDTGTTIKVDPCCPPWSQQALEAMMVPVPTGGSGDPYLEKFIPASTLNAQMQAYIDYLHAVDALITTISITFQLLDSNGAILETQTAQWTTGGAYPTPNLFATQLVANHDYVIRTRIGLNGGKTFFPGNCDNAAIKVRKP